MVGKMATSVLQQYTISDFLEWHKTKQLELNPSFQRRSVWTNEAKSYLMHSVLSQLPMPKIFIRSVIDVRTQRPYREVVDGQQRLRAIIEFASNELVLGSRAKEFKGYKYETLPDELKQQFLSYTIAVEQLINASDEDVLEIFARLNSYNVRLNDAELRHAEFQGDFKWAVHEAAKRWKVLWDDLGLLTLQQRVRMQDDSLMAEMFGVVIRGVTDGGQANIRKLYVQLDKQFSDSDDAIRKVDDTVSFIVHNLRQAVDGPVASGPHFLMLFAATAHALFGIPAGQMNSLMPQRDPSALSDITLAVENIRKLSSIIELDEPPEDREFLNFWRASSRTTQRIASRKIRFPLYYKALLPRRL